jgi:hypothetical protein
MAGQLVISRNPVLRELTLVRERAKITVLLQSSLIARTFL